MNPSPHILLAPLDWGLGHTTRLVAIGRELAFRQAQLVLAGTPWQLEVLSEAFRDAPCVELPGYHVSYGKRLPAAWHVVRQFPRLRKVIRQEHEQVKQIVTTHRIDAILSDNRYGVWHPDCRNAIVCHQLIPPLRGLSKPVRPFLWRQHQRFLAPFQDLLIPDLPGPGGLSVAMRPDRLPRNAQMIGWLSRLQGMIPKAPPYLPDHLPAPDLIALLSGPEPQRTILETRIREEIASLPMNCWVVQGLPGQSQKLPRSIPGGLLSPYLDAAALAYWLPRAGTVLARSGYSSLMDFASLGLRNLVLVPTRGQPEQEFLAGKLFQAGKAGTWNPGKETLQQGLLRADKAVGFRKSDKSTQLLRSWVGSWVAELF